MKLANDTTRQIGAFFHCKQCYAEWEKLEFSGSPAEYQRIEAGWTKVGFQVWCQRHDCNLIHIDFEGAKIGA